MINIASKLNSGLLNRMDLSTLYSFYSQLQSDNLSLAYQGEFSDDMTEKLISLSEYHIENVDELKKSKKKISFLIAESFQNIVRHGDNVDLKQSMENKIGVFFTRNIGNAYYITSANVIENQNIGMLKTTIEKVNSLGAEDLKALHMNVLANEGLSSKGGAGLGLIEMARKSGHKLEYEFETINDKFSYFYLQVKLLGHGTEDGGNKQSLSTIKDLRRRINDENILLIYKGDFSEDSIMPVLKMIKDNMEKNDEGFIIKKRVYMVLVEMLQNISRHSLSQNGLQLGIMMVSKKDDRYIINTGNLVESSATDKLKANLNRINIASRNELSEMHTKRLIEGSISEKGGAGLGLMDIAKKSCDKLNYTFVPMNEGVTFFGLNAQV